uniref:Uncharacterized protein n=1 Tax=Pseudictyota dubia TaxID=2749911 RepID=A0A7R9VYJ4_9STRA|mmetsp:Transcript_25563/g.47661  ORF Transcript_25563/g.47661 Transcript_25563/m.47661 type:complete len:249 (+) Transcript_25563:120-866(+)
MGSRRMFFSKKATVASNSSESASDFMKNSIHSNLIEKDNHKKKEVLRREISTKALKKNGRTSPMTRKGIVSMIRKQKWAALEKHINTSKGRFELVMRSKERDRRNRTILHLLCERRPPASLAKSFIHLCSGLVSATDRKLWTPLHTAIAHYADVQVIECLLRANNNLAVMRDREGKVPLAIEAQKPKSDAAIARLLVKTNRATVLFRDKSGRIPYEHALEAKASESVLDCLSLATDFSLEEKAKIDLQ